MSLFSIIILLILIAKQLIKEYNKQIEQININHMYQDKFDKKNKNKARFKDQNQKISRKLSSILRHNAIQYGLKIDAAGYVRLDEVLNYLNTKGGFHDVDEPIIRKVVENNDKKRFQLTEKGHHLCIRATQGHSIKQVQTEQLLKKITDPQQYPIVLHGTFFKFWDLIKNGGLKRMSRNHIHFAPGLPQEDGVISGMRKSCDVFIYIDMVQAIKDGINFYISSNNVILTEGIKGVLPPKYFKKVLTRKGVDLIGKAQKKQEE